ncbi:MAG: AAA family ATPase [Promethearchaeota archaeon]
MKRFLFTGVRGIGKSTMIKTITTSIPQKIQYFSFSSVLKDIMGKENFLTFDFLPDKKKELYRIKVIEYLKKFQQQNHVDLLIEGHVTLFNYNTNEIDLVFTDLDCKFFTDIILLEIPAKKILNFRANDMKKKRMIDLEIIQMEILKERVESQRISKKYGMNFYLIQNFDLKDVNQRIIKILTESTI